MHATLDYRSFPYRFFNPLLHKITGGGRIVSDWDAVHKMHFLDLISLIILVFEFKYLFTII